MSKLETANEQLESVAVELDAKYGVPDYSGVDCVSLSGLRMAYGMTRLDMRHQTPEEHANKFVEAADPLQANPDIRIETYDDKSYMVTYRHDRATGLTLVNNFWFNHDEVRPLTRTEYDALRFSFSTSNIARSLGNRVLTSVGVERLSEDMEKALDQAARV